jgi:23S rRNA (adenine2503-C2)-methyltransferase
LLAGRKAHVNLIPWNDVTGLPYRRPRDADLQGLIDTLRARGISVKVRKRKGSEIDAACGQLRREAERARGQGTGDRGHSEEDRGQRTGDGPTPPTTPTPS